MEEFKTIVIEALPFIAVLGGVALLAISRKWLKGRSSQLEKVLADQMLSMIVEQAINYAEKKATERREDEEVSTDQEKLYEIIDKVKELMADAGLVEIAEEEIKARINSATSKESE